MWRRFDCNNSCSSDASPYGNGPCRAGNAPYNAGYDSGDNSNNDADHYDARYANNFDQSNLDKSC